MPVAREGFSANVVKDKIYVIGGWTPNRFLATTEEYDPIADRWENKSPMPTARTYFASCVVNDKIYVIGGNRDFGTAISTVEVYDPETDTWEKKADIKIARCNHSAIEVKGKIYVIGGSPSFIMLFPNEPLSSVEEYDTGFKPQNVNNIDKITSTWGNIKAIK